MTEDYLSLWSGDAAVLRFNLQLWPHDGLAALLGALRHARGAKTEALSRCCVILALVAGCTAPDEDAWKQAGGAGTAEAYQAFLAAYPKSRHAAEARGRLDDLAFAALEREVQAVLKVPPPPPPSTPTRWGYPPAESAIPGALSRVESFLGTRADHKHAGAVRDMLVELNYRRALLEGTLAALDEFVVRFADTKAAAEATRRITEMESTRIADWRKARRARVVIDISSRTISDLGPAREKLALEEFARRWLRAASLSQVAEANQGDGELRLQIMLEPLSDRYRFQSGEVLPFSTGARVSGEVVLTANGGTPRRQRFSAQWEPTESVHVRVGAKGLAAGDPLDAPFLEVLREKGSMVERTRQLMEEVFGPQVSARAGKLLAMGK